MEYYLAPLEGITGYIYRNAYKDCFGQMDKYYTPFISPGKKCLIGPKEMRDVCIEHNQGMKLIPQILTNHADGFVDTAKQLEQMGYTEINLNLGCPSKTVVSKHKGAGFLEDCSTLDRFLDQIFNRLTIDVSIKTRIGIEFEEEFEDLLKIYNRYPLKELIVHPRLQTDYYQGKIHKEIFAFALQESKNPVCYNGDLFTAQDVKKLKKEYPKVQTLMFGRGIIANPFLLEEIQNEGTNIEEQIRRERLKKFHDRLVNDYDEVFQSDTPTLYKMKEIWSYLLNQFEGSQKYGKRIRKAKYLSDYKSVVEELFASCPICQ